MCLATSRLILSEVQGRNGARGRAGSHSATLVSLGLKTDAKSVYRGLATRAVRTAWRRREPRAGQMGCPGQMGRVVPKMLERSVNVSTRRFTPLLTCPKFEGMRLSGIQNRLSIECPVPKMPLFKSVSTTNHLCSHLILCPILVRNCLALAFNEQLTYRECLALNCAQMQCLPI